MGDNYKSYLIYYLAYGNIDTRPAFGTFDPQSYAARYPDVKAKYGNNVTALFSHWITLGKAAGKDGSKGTVTPKITVASSSSSSSSNDSDYDPYDGKKKKDDDDDDSSSSCSSNSSTPAPSHEQVATRTSTGIDYERTRSTGDDAGKTIVTGRLLDENDRPLAHVRVDASNSNVAASARGFVLCDSTNSDAPGRFYVYTDDDGNYRFEFRAEDCGTLRFTARQENGIELNIGTLTVDEGYTTRIEAAPVLPAAEEGHTYKVAGTLRSATEQDRVIPGATVKLYRGWGAASSAEVVATTTTDSNGKYSFNDVERGYYTARFSMNGYVDYVKNVISAENAVARNNATLTAQMDTNVEYRIVLKWGEIPRDLDSHFTGPTSDGGRFHVYFADKRHDEDGALVAQLDVDDTSSFGPETITVVRLPRSGQYRYSVLNFSHQFADDTQLATSGATVEVYSGTNKIKEYTVPSGEGYIWNVFDIQDGEIVTINTHSGSQSSMLTGESYCDEPRVSCTEHTWSEDYRGTSITVNGETRYGHAHYCTVCGNVDTEHLEEHTPDTERWYGSDNGHSHPCTICGAYISSLEEPHIADETYCVVRRDDVSGHAHGCSVCHAPAATEIEPHVYGNEYSSCDDGHKPMCTVCHDYDYYAAFEAHTYENGVCTVCGYHEPASSSSNDSSSNDESGSDSTPEEEPVG